MVAKYWYGVVVVWCDWKGVFYPTNISAPRMLEEYVSHFRTTEINSSFYRLPNRNTLVQWWKPAPADFIFSVKASRYITHMKKLKESKDNVSTLPGRIKMLGDRLGPILFQLPPRFYCNEERLAVFLETLPGGFRYVFEFRDQSWLNKRIYRLLADHNAAFCIYELDGFLSPREVTADLIYVRLHGPGGPYKGNYDSIALAGWAETCANWSAQGGSIYCYFDNDEKGYAAVNARTLQDMVGGVPQQRQR